MVKPIEFSYVDKLYDLLALSEQDDLVSSSFSSSLRWAIFVCESSLPAEDLYE